MFKGTHATQTPWIWLNRPQIHVNYRLMGPTGPMASRSGPLGGAFGLLLLQLLVVPQQGNAQQWAPAAAAAGSSSTSSSTSSSSISSSRSGLLPSFYPATDERIQWVGRVLQEEETGRTTFDWPGVTARFGLERASTVEVAIDDSTPTGTRFAVYLDGPARQFGREHVQTFLTRQGSHSYTLASGEVLESAGSVVVSLMHTQEARFIDAGPASNITVLGFSTDGFFAEGGPQPRRPWRMEVC